MSTAMTSRYPRFRRLAAACVAVCISSMGTGCPFDTPVPPTEPFDQTTATYVGSQACSACHGEIYARFMNSGHPYKLNKIEGDQAPSYPSFAPGIGGALAKIGDDDAALGDGTPDPNTGGTDNTLGTPAGYADVSYVIGGFGWKARWIDRDGYIVTGSDVQYNLKTQGMVAYHNNEQDKKYNCGNCHATGWKAYTSEAGDSRNLNRQDNLPGMAGTFAAPGVQCEACHGAGSAHVAGGGDKTKITKVAGARTTGDFKAEHMAYGLPVACSECHTRDGEKDYPDYTGGAGLILASGGLIRHHEQYDELQGINPDNPGGGPTGPHAALACTACHDPHTTTKYRAVSGDPPGVKTACAECHPGHEITSGGMKQLACTDCHMPLLVKSAIKNDAVGTGPITGDIHSHIFRPDLSQSRQFTDDGKYAYPWITAEWACKTCHNGVDAVDFDLSFLAGRTIHGS